MNVHRLAGDGLTIRVAERGGSIVDGHWHGLPFLRPAASGLCNGYTVAQAANFPLVPFGNRVAGNGFAVDGNAYRLRPNTDDDPLYLHGDGWLADWRTAALEPDSVMLVHEKAADETTPYRYRAEQRIAVGSGRLDLYLSVENRGPCRLPFGLGQHLFFPLTAATQLQAAASHLWTEAAGHLPGERRPVSNDLDFRSAAPVPHRWINNAFEGWDGKARIVWPHVGLGVEIEAEPAFACYMLYMPDEDADFVCFEPMTHLPDGHNMEAFGGLRLLARGETLSGRMSLRPFRMKE